MSYNLYYECKEDHSILQYYTSYIFNTFNRIWFQKSDHGSKETSYPYCNIIRTQGEMGYSLQRSAQKLNEKHPDMDIKIDYTVLPYDATRTQLLTAMAGRTPIDLVSVDQTWLGEFAQGGFLSDLTDRAKSWGKEKDWYQTNWEGGKYNGKLYGIWAWTDIRAMWYWKDLLSKAGISPDSLKTWNGYIADAKQLNNVPKRPRNTGGAPRWCKSVT